MKKREKENSFLSLTPIFIIPLAVILWMYFFFIKENKFVRETLLSGWIGIIVLLVFDALVNLYALIVGNKGQHMKNLNGGLLFMTLIIWVASNTELLMKLRLQIGNWYYLICGIVVVGVWVIIKILFLDW